MKRKQSVIRKLVMSLKLSAAAREALDQMPTDKALKRVLTKALYDWARVCTYTQAQVVARENASYQQGCVDGLRKRADNISHEVRPDMIEAGVRVLQDDRENIHDPTGWYASTAKKVFMAMEARRKGLK